MPYKSTFHFTLGECWPIPVYLSSCRPTGCYRTCGRRELCQSAAGRSCALFVGWVTSWLVHEAADQRETRRRSSVQWSLVATDHHPARIHRDPWSWPCTVWPTSDSGSSRSRDGGTSSSTSRHSCRRLPAGPTRRSADRRSWTGIALPEHTINPLTPTAAIMCIAINHPVPDRVKPSFVIFDIRALWRSAWASKG